MGLFRKWFRSLVARGPAEMEVALGIIVRHVLEKGDADTGYRLITRGCTLRGVPVGDWEFTARRIPPEEPSTPVDAGRDNPA